MKHVMTHRLVHRGIVHVVLCQGQEIWSRFTKRHAPGYQRHVIAAACEQLEVILRHVKECPEQIEEPYQPVYSPYTLRDPWQ